MRDMEKGAQYGMRRTLRCPVLFGALLALCAAAAAEDELVRNGGFEDADETPVGWDLFVDPHEGAGGGLAEEGAAEGSRCVYLEVGAPYPRDPLNNWSQNVLADVAGKELVARASVRTEAAGEAAVWVQCWRREPWSMIQVASSATDRRITGTRDWTTLEWRVTVPRQTDYITIRCVLKGTGKAWFDAVGLREASTVKASEAEAKAKPPDKPAPPKPPAKGPETAAKEAEKKAAAAKPAPAPAQNDLANANRVLLEGYEALKRTNDALAEQIRALQEETRALREELQREREGNRGAAGADLPADAEAPQPPRMPSPPLVPSGQVWEGD